MSRRNHSAPRPAQRITRVEDLPRIAIDGSPEELTASLRELVVALNADCTSHSSPPFPPLSASCSCWCFPIHIPTPWYPFPPVVLTPSCRDVRVGCLPSMFLPCPFLVLRGHAPARTTQLEAAVKSLQPAISRDSSSRCCETTSVQQQAWRPLACCCKYLFKVRAHLTLCVCIVPLR